MCTDRISALSSNYFSQARCRVLGFFGGTSPQGGAPKLPSCRLPGLCGQTSECLPLLRPDAPEGEDMNFTLDQHCL